MPVDLDSILEDGGLAALTDDQLSVSVLKVLLSKHDNSKYTYNRYLVNRKRTLGNSNLHNNCSGKKSPCSSTMNVSRLAVTLGKN